MKCCCHSVVVLQSSLHSAAEAVGLRHFRLPGVRETEEFRDKRKAEADQAKLQDKQRKRRSKRKDKNKQKGKAAAAAGGGVKSDKSS